MVVKVETKCSKDELGEKGWKHLKEAVKESIESILGLRVEVELLEPNSLPRVEGKIKRVVDER